MGFSHLLQPQNREVGRKLGLATGFMFTMPFVAYYVALTWVFYDKQNPDNWAAAVAICVTNAIVAAYCYSAFQEDDDDQDGKKGRTTVVPPRVGRFKKERTD